MLSYSQLATLERDTRDALVLNAYIDATELDSVARRAWRKTLADSITAIRKSLAGASHAERKAFDEAAARLEAQAAQLSDDLDGAPGWVGFITADDIRYGSPTAAPPAPSLVWRRGIATAPYLRVIRDDASVILTLADTRVADIYRWTAGEPERVDRIQAHAHVGRAAHMGDTPVAGFHTGTRGTTLTDAAQRAVDVGRERMVRDVAEQIETLARPAGWIVVAGLREVAMDVMKHLGKAASKRALYLGGLSADASIPEIARAAAEGRDTLRASHERDRVNDLIDRAAGRNRGVLGLQPTLDALVAGAARDVSVTASVFTTRPDDAEALALAVLTHGARLHEVSGDAAARLDAECGGVAASLRFPSRTGRAKLAVAKGSV